MNIDLNTKEWLGKYISGHYNVPDKYVHNLPSLIEQECKHITTPITLFRGIQPDITWINNEVINYDYNNKIITIKPKTITSWSSNKDVAKYFNEFIISKTFYPNEILCDLSELNSKEQEYLIYPGIYKCLVEYNNVQNILYKEVDIDTSNDLTDSIDTSNDLEYSTDSIFKDPDFLSKYTSYKYESEYKSEYEGEHHGLFIRNSDKHLVNVTVHQNYLQSYCELISNKFYNDMNIPVPDSYIENINGTVYYISKFLNYNTHVNLYNTKSLYKFVDGIIYDIFLLNIYGNMSSRHGPYYNLIEYKNILYRNTNGSMLFEYDGTLKDSKEFSEWIMPHWLPIDYENILKTISYTTEYINQINFAFNKINKIHWKGYIKNIIPEIKNDDLQQLLMFFDKRLIALKSQFHLKKYNYKKNMLIKQKYTGSR